MVLKIVSVITIFVTFFLTPIHGNSLKPVLNFLQNFNFQHLDFVSINFLKVDMMTYFHDDNSISILIEESEKFVKPLSSLQNDQKENHNILTLNIIPFEGITIIDKSHPNCQVKGQFIKENYQSYLIFGSGNISQDNNQETFINIIKCNFPYQPYVYAFMQKNSYNYDLYEVQVVSHKFVHLATWNSSTKNIRYNFQIYPINLIFLYFDT